jgi:hypothetical protein
MQFNTVTLLALVGLVAALPASDRVTKRTAAAIESAIATVSSKLTTLDSQISSFNGNIIVALELLTTFNDLKTDITTATTDITSNGALDDTNSATIYADITALTTKITTVLADVDAKVLRLPFCPVLVRRRLILKIKKNRLPPLRTPAIPA